MIGKTVPIPIFPGCLQEVFKSGAKLDDFRTLHLQQDGIP